MAEQLASKDYPSDEQVVTALRVFTGVLHRRATIGMQPNLAQAMREALFATRELK